MQIISEKKEKEVAGKVSAAVLKNNGPRVSLDDKRAGPVVCRQS
jgi:hypothetical protein